MRLALQKRFISLCLVSSMLLSITPQLSADEILLKNGDRISGETIRMENGKLTVKTGYADKISIDWDQVLLLTADMPLYVVFLDGTARKTQALFFREGLADEMVGEGETPLEKIDAAQVKRLSTKPGPRIQVTARLDAGLSNQRGNTDTDAYNIIAEFIARAEKHRLFFGGNFSSQKAGGENTAENWRALGEYDYFIRQKWFLYANTLFENNRFADLNLRSTLSAGGGYQAFESDALNLSISFGPSYVKEDFIVAGDSEFSAGQWILHYDQLFFDNLFELFHSNLATISIKDADNWNIRTRQGLRFYLYKGLATTFQYNYDYNNAPSPAAETKWDSKFLILLGYEFQN